MQRMLVLLLLLAACSTPASKAPPKGPQPPSGPASGPAPTCSKPDDFAPDLITADDLQQVARKLAADILAGPWLAQLTRAKGPPAIRFYPMRNRTALHLQLRIISRSIEAALLRSGKVKVVADLESAGDLRQERVRRAGKANPPALANETGADLIFNGWVTQVSDSPSATVEINELTFVAELLSVDDSRKVWMGNVVVKRMTTRLPPCPAPARPDGGAAPR